MADEIRDKILEKVDSNRRGFLKRVLGASFAVPLIATFSIDSLSVDMAKAQENPNTTDFGNQDYFFNSFFY